MLVAEYDYDLDIEVQREEAMEEGVTCGLQKGKAESIIEILEDIGDASYDLKERILNQSDLEILKSWVKIAARVNSIEEFEQSM